MRTQDSMLSVEVDAGIMRKATETLAAVGLTASEAVRLFFHRIAVDKTLPFEVEMPNAETRKAMAESEEMIGRGTSRFASADEMFAELEEVGKR